MPEASGKQEHFIGVDLGGTKILTGVFDSKLRCLERNKMSTKPERGPEAVIERIARCVLHAIDECDLSRKQIRAVGIGAPGTVDPDNGRVLFAGNLNWKDVPLRKELEKQIDVPVFVENDCNACTLGVHEAEFEGKPRQLAGIFLGTGVGGGLILDRKLYTGFNRTAGEIGHMVLAVDGPECTCGNRGCFEALASRTAIFRNIKSAVKEGQKTILTELLGDGLENLRSGDLRKAVKRGDKFVERVVRSAAEYTGIAVANLINLFNPEVIALGGGIMEQLEEEMMPTITETALDFAFPGTARGIEIRATKLGDDAGITGGAVLARMRAG